MVWLRHQWFHSQPDKADGSTSHHSWQKTLIARIRLPPTTRRASPQPPALCQPLPRLAGQGRPGYNRWKRITGAQSTRCGHWRRIARCGSRYSPRWSGTAVSEWSSHRNEVNNTQFSPDNKFSPTFPWLLEKIPDISRFLRLSWWVSTP